MAVSRAHATHRSLSHLLLAGFNPLASTASSSFQGQARQSLSNPSLAPVPLSGWLAAVGREADVVDPLARPYSVRPGGIAGGAGHSLVTYRSWEGMDRIMALGRNEAGQLGVGFASQEGTRGLVEGFEGEEILSVRAGVQSTYVLVRDEGAFQPWPLASSRSRFLKDRTILYSSGNLARGRLGQPALYSPSSTAEDAESSRQHTLPRATVVELPAGEGRLKQIEAGFEHLLVLTENGQVFGTGCNTDGQLGLGSASSDIYQLTRLPLPREVEKEGGVERISAGADTSAIITKSGKVWTFGNSEYCQAMHGQKIDQIVSPLPIDSSFLPSNRRIIDYRCGGSFALALDDRGSVYSAGYGALGLGKDTLQLQKPQRIDSLEGAGIDRIRAAWGYAAAVREDSSALFTWGLNTVHGRLGLGALPHSSSSGPPNPHAPPAVPMHVYEPQEVKLPLRELGLDGTVGGRESVRWKLGEVELGMEGMWVGLDVSEELD
ncbi:putative Uvb-resistance protein uvr8 [Rhodotorula toruloides ATCC 204091]|uniref:Putative Uvb-resistance protein uvr8 n=1 Tax=Rhodotorula toruloides TaxID=5286 RepID=A0A2T0AIG6_RHOTO|nr:putative Uvb-resistance protein uvr8 [Rhodotorula toruloides ATCC 204091]PRQ77811.1 putative Uvb-resistance protein uvr8 [Rhodotorula toruloides]